MGTWGHVLRAMFQPVQWVMRLTKGRAHFLEWNSRAREYDTGLNPLPGEKRPHLPDKSKLGTLSQFSAPLWTHTGRGIILRWSLLYTSVWDLLMGIPSGTEKPI